MNAKKGFYIGILIRMFIITHCHTFGQPSKGTTKLMPRVIRNRDRSNVDWQLTIVDLSNRYSERNRALCIDVD